MAKVPITTVREFSARLEGVTGRARAALRREFAETYGVSATTLSRMLCEVGYRERSRSDAGTRRVPVDDAKILELAAIQRSSLSLRKGVTMPAEDVINIAEDSGLIDQGALAPSTYNNWLRSLEVSRREQARIEGETDYVHTTLRSLGPNHVHQVDFSLAVNWKIFQGRPQYEHLVYKNKLPSAGTPRLWRLIVVDHASGAFFTHYSQSTGETVQATLEGLYRAWAPKVLNGEGIERIYPFRGVPRILMADRGSANQAQITETVLERLGVKLLICGSSRAKGTVEVSHRIWEDHFESRMRLQVPESVEQLNEWALDFAVKMSARPHSRHGAPRSAIWAWHVGRRPETQLRELRCDFETFKAIAVTEPQKCQVRGNRTIRFRSKVYRVPDQVQAESSVFVQYSPFDFPNIYVRASEATGAPCYVCEPIELDEFGFPVDAPVIGQEFHSQKQTPTKRMVAAAEVIRRGFEESQELKVYGHHRHGVKPVEVRPVGTEALELAAPEVRYTRIQAREEVIARVGRSLEMAERNLMLGFGDTVTEAEVEAVVMAIEQGVTAPVIAFRTTAG